MNWRRVRHIIRKEVLQLRRDPRLLAIVLVAPIFQLFLFGYAVTTDVRHISTGIWDEDRSPASRALRDRLAATGYFELNYTPASAAEVDRLLDSGQAQVVIHLPPTFSQDLAHNRPAPVQVVLDASDSMTAGIISGYVTGVLGQYSQELLVTRLQRLTRVLPTVPGIDARLRVWYNPDLRSVNFMVPGVLCTLLVVVTTVLTALAIVKEREIGTLEQLIVTPISPRELMLGKTVPFAVLGYMNFTLVMTIAVLWFRVPFAGSLLLLIVLTSAFLLASLGAGLFISTISHTQQQAMVTGFFFLLPSILLSGFMFPIANMPRIVQALTYLIPLRYFLVIIRGIFLKGNGIDVLWPQAAALIVLGVGILTLSAARFTKRVG
jgi:ABC-2 type transport system permease protein